MAITAKQKTLVYEQLNHGSPEEVFPLLCPEREKDWLDGWHYDLIYSKSGNIEKNCVFSTPDHGHGKRKTIWIVTQYDPINYKVEFVRFTPKEMVVKIKISLTGHPDHTTCTLISYTYTALNNDQNDFSELEKEFRSNMIWWEKSINHYLRTGRKLIKSHAVPV